MSGAAAGKFKRVLVVSPHPDDESIGCGGTLRGHVLAGDEARALFLTSGEEGGHGLSPRDTLQVREEEAKTAAQILGIKQVDFWRLPDGKLQPTEDLACRLAAYLGDWSPDFLYVTHEGEMHPDHRAAAAIVRQAIAGLHIAAVPQVRMYEVWTPLQQLDEIIDISEFLPTKLAAVRAHQSQCRVLGFDEAIRGLNRYRGEMHCWPEGDYAEVFALMRT